MGVLLLVVIPNATSHAHSILRRLRNSGFILHMNVNLTRITTIQNSHHGTHSQLGKNRAGKIVGNALQYYPHQLRGDSGWVHQAIQNMLYCEYGLEVCKYCYRGVGFLWREGRSLALFLSLNFFPFFLRFSAVYWVPV